VNDASMATGDVPLVEETAQVAHTQCICSPYIQSGDPLASAEVAQIIIQCATLP